MKNIFCIICITLSMISLSPNVLATETKKVCNTLTDSKTKKPKEVCKTIKVHKKLEKSDDTTDKKK